MNIKRFKIIPRYLNWNNIPEVLITVMVKNLALNSYVMYFKNRLVYVKGSDDSIYAFNIIIIHIRNVCNKVVCALCTLCRSNISKNDTSVI